MTDNTKMREAFEKWAEGYDIRLVRDGVLADDYADGDAEIAWRAWQAAQSVPVGMRVSVDTSTGEHDAGNRVFAVVTGQQDDGRGGLILLCEEESRNFEQSVPVVGEPVGFVLLHEDGGKNLTFHDNTGELSDGWSQHKLIIQPSNSIPAAELNWLLYTAQAYGEQMCKSHDLREVERIRAAIAQEPRHD